ncbi:hypothetical protein GE061_001683 [Apolygus lucorum]|uniref:Uncharacterized protein n=1 Tax=Apolygus lucorum TaxID=248454 RepID=A0A6A4KKA4_APOLU|nr:hypothetical protein GE061_001683 [Apolygus lucorum]
MMEASAVINMMLLLNGLNFGVNGLPNNCTGLPPECYDYERLVCDQEVRWLCISKDIFVFDEQPPKIDFIIKNHINKPLHTRPFVPHSRASDLLRKKAPVGLHGSPVKRRPHLKHHPHVFNVGNSDVPVRRTAQSRLALSHRKNFFRHQRNLKPRRTWGVLDIPGVHSRFEVIMMPVAPKHRDMMFAGRKTPEKRNLTLDTVWLLRGPLSKPQIVTQGSSLQPLRRATRKKMKWYLGRK